MNSDADFDPAEEANFAEEQSSASEETVDEDTFSEQAIEDAYMQALLASDEAGIAPPAGFEAMSVPSEAVLESTPLSESADQAASNQAGFEDLAEQTTRPGFTAQQIIESILFVGGESLSARKISNLLGSRSEEESVRGWIDQINQRYETQCRPYEIQLGEQGYQLVLRPEFQAQRNQVFGIGPREVRLSQEAMEVLSFVAYQQPVTKKQIQEVNPEKAIASLRQLIRRELVAVSRVQETEEPEYHVTDRFLQLFGLNSLEDLPRAEELSFK
ncbi:MAG: SMC-Scp complex subunit ScpB [Planctomycetaceae bacterium]|nr:SMC-Scp complex subunit ScpB [Planctomycetaceae bacterium]